MSDQLLFMWSTFRDSSIGTKQKYFWKTHETVNSARIFLQNMSHEQLPFTWSTIRDSSMGTKLKYLWKTHGTVKSTWFFSQKHVLRTITFHVIHITSLRVLPVENAATLHFYDPFINMSLSQTSFTGCNQPPKSVLLPECCRRCCCLCCNCYLVMKLVVFVNRGFVPAMRIVRSFSSMPQYQFFLYCSFRLWKDCCLSVTQVMNPKGR